MKTIEPIVSELFNIDREETYILFYQQQQLMPAMRSSWYAAIRYGKAHPDLWVGEER